MKFKSSQHNPTLPSAMKTKLMLVALLASASMAQAGPPITPAKIKRPLPFSQITSIFPRAEPTAPAPQASVPVQKGSAAVKQTGASAQQATAGVPSSVEATNTAASETSPVSRKVHLNTFLNHPKTAAGPK